MIGCDFVCYLRRTKHALHYYCGVYLLSIVDLKGIRTIKGTLFLHWSGNPDRKTEIPASKMMENVQQSYFCLSLLLQNLG